MSTGAGAVAAELQATPVVEPKKSMDTPGDDRVRTGAAVVAESFPPPSAELASRELQPTTTTTTSNPTPAPSSGPHGSHPPIAGSVETQPPQEQHLTSQPAADMVVPVKDPADAKQRQPETPAASLPKSPSPAGAASPVPPSPNGNALNPSGPPSRPASAVGDKEDIEMGAEGSKISPGKFRKASSTDVNPAEEKSTGAKRSASSSGGFFTRNGRESVSGPDVTNGHRESVHSLEEEIENPVAHDRPGSAAGSRSSSRQGIHPVVGAGVDSGSAIGKSSPPAGSPSPGIKGSKSPLPERVSSKSPSPDLIKEHSRSPMTMTSQPKSPSPTDKNARDAMKMKTPSPDIHDVHRDSPDLKRMEASRGKSPMPQDGRDAKCTSPEALKTSSNASLRATGNTTPDVGKQGRRTPEELRDGDAEPTGRKTPGSDISRSKSPLPSKSKTPSPDLRNSSPTVISDTKVIASAPPKTGTDGNGPPDRQHVEQTKRISLSPEPIKSKPSTPDIPGRQPSPSEPKPKPNSPDLKKESIKPVEQPETNTNKIFEDINRGKSPMMDTKVAEADGKNKQKSPSPEIGLAKSPFPTCREKTLDRDSQRSQQSTPDIISDKKKIDEISIKGGSSDKSKIGTPDHSPKSSTPEVPMSKSTPEPPNSTPRTPEPFKSKPPTPEPSKSKASSLSTSDMDIQRSGSRLSNISDGDIKDSSSLAAVRSKPATPDIQAGRKLSPEPVSPKPSTSEPDKARSPQSDLQRTKSGSPDLAKPSTPVERSVSKTPDPLKSNSPSLESGKPDHPPPSPKPQLDKNTLQRRTSPQQLASKSPSPETGHRRSNPPSIPPSPEPIKASPSPSPDILMRNSPSQKENLQQSMSPGLRDSPGKTPEPKTPTALTKSPSPDSAKQKPKDERGPSPSHLVKPSSTVEPTKPPGKVSPTKMEELPNRVPTPQQTNIPSDSAKSLSPPLTKESPHDILKSESPSPAKSSPPKGVSPNIPSPANSASPEPSKLPPSPYPKSPSPSNIRGKVSPPKSPIPTSVTPPLTVDKLPADGKHVLSAVENDPSPAISKSPSPTPDKAASQTVPKSPTPTKTPSPILAKSPSPTAEKSQLREPVGPAPKSGAPTPEPRNLKSMDDMQRSVTPTPSKREKTPSPELSKDTKQKSPSPTDLTTAKRPGSRQGTSPEVVLSPSEDSGRISASPDLGRKSSSSPKPCSPQPSPRTAATPTTATPTSPSGHRPTDSATDEQKTPDSAITPADMKATAASSPTSEVGDETSTASRTGSASARPSSVEAATPDDDAKTAKTVVSDESKPSLQNGEVTKNDKETKVEGETKKKKTDPSKPGTPSRTPRSSRSIAASPRTPRRTTPRARRKDGDHEKDRSSSRAKSEDKKASTNGEVLSPTKKSPTKIPAAKKSPGTPTAATSSPARPPLKSPAKSAPKTPPAVAPPAEPEKKKVPMNKVQVGTAASPNLKAVRSKIGSLENATYKPGGGKVKIENRKLDFSKAAPKIAAKNDTYVPGGGDKKIQQVKLTWSAKPKVGSLDNATYKPGGGEKKIETVKLDFKDKAKPKVGSKDNIKHAPGGGTVKKTASTKDDTNSNVSPAFNHQNEDRCP
ncbi:nascent polypeptide-associated complex subunit alpha, muscle-specific form-like isoform X3 [Ischnura elegans]|uniref:nascent polypeptide-associated complex subunit alpha, muscle-specific form-like isoform X3 n=1 Tax=Ischnura elegans TaxID=197161 RepID=UPI001ED87688|nr:nascent polypeptide-associated complex subunit alpha, muscle-specific form-like isoform X3 [Ischnura elegans]